jgi:pilus assembly protein CpaB
MVLRDVRVIATGQQLVQGTVTANGTASPPPSATTVTLEVTPEDAQIVAVATRLGSLSLVVHSSEAAPVSAMNPTQTAAANQPVFADQVSPALANLHSTPGVVSTVHVFQGSGDSEDYKF